tara:strand:+ start:5726 stop:5959 length:234 start_codon:yes stop_codon:yes gene_type:complete
MVRDEKIEWDELEAKAKELYDAGKNPNENVEFLQMEVRYFRNELRRNQGARGSLAVYAYEAWHQAQILIQKLKGEEE